MQPLLPSSPQSQSPSSPTTGGNEPAFVIVVRILATVGGAVYLTVAGKIPAYWTLIVLACVAMPAQVGTILDFVRGRR